MCVCVCVCMCVSVMVVVLHPPKPKPPYRPKGGLIGMYVCRRFGVVRRPLDVPQSGKSASFRSCVRAGEAKLRVCVSEIMLLYAGLPILEFLCCCFSFFFAYGTLCFA